MTNSRILSYGKILVDTGSCKVTYDGKPVRLYRQQYRLLILFLQYPNHILSYDVIIDNLWDESNLPTESTIRSHIKSLRKAFKKFKTGTAIVENVYGLGYRLGLVKGDGDSKDIPIAPSLSLLQKFLKAKAIEYLVVVQNLVVKSISPGLSIYSDYPELLKIGRAAGEAFPELIGCEEVFEKVRNQEQQHFEIKGIARACNPLRPEYINIYAIADAENKDRLGEPLLFIFFEDDSEYMLYRQRLVQQEHGVYLVLEKEHIA